MLQWASRSSPSGPVQSDQRGLGGMGGGTRSKPGSQSNKEMTHTCHAEREAPGESRPGTGKGRTGWPRGAQGGGKGGEWGPGKLGLLTAAGSDFSTPSALPPGL